MGYDMCLIFLENSTGSQLQVHVATSTNNFVLMIFKMKLFFFLDSVSFRKKKTTYLINIIGKFNRNSNETTILKNF